MNKHRVELDANGVTHQADWSSPRGGRTACSITFVWPVVLEDWPDSTNVAMAVQRDADCMACVARGELSKQGDT